LDSIKGREFLDQPSYYQLSRIMLYGVSESYLVQSEVPVFKTYKISYFWFGINYIFKVVFKLITQ